MKVSDSKYAQMVGDARKIYADTGSVLWHDPDEWGISKFRPSKSGDIEFVFYWNGLSRILTPDGEIVPLGSRSGGDDDKALELLTEKFGLVKISERDGMKGERWITYKVTKS